MRFQRLRYLFRFSLVVLASFILQKLAFLFFTRPAGEELTLQDLLAVCGHGLSLDSSVLGYLLVFPLLIVGLSGILAPHPLRKVLTGYHGFISLLLALMTIGDLRLYPFWGFKLDATIFQYLDTPGEAVASVDLSFILVSLLLVALWTIGLFFALRWSLQGVWEKPRRPWLTLTASLLSLAPTFLLIRGSVTQATANVGQVYFTDRPWLNHAAVNPTFSLISSLTKLEDYDAEYNFFPEEERAKLFAGLYPPPSPAADTLLKTTHPNILLILMESFGARYVGCLGGEPGVSPHFDRLAQEGVLFTQCYANSYRTDRGMLSTLSGYPSFPKHSLMKLPAKSRTLSSLALQLKGQGYSTSFFYGGDANFTNTRGYLVSTGYDKVTDEHTLSRQLPRSNWGVPDAPMLDLVYEEIQREPQGRPWHKLLLTLSSHEPFDVPYQRLERPVPNAFAYLDASLGSFIDRLKATPAWKNLLVICIADHGYTEDGRGVRNVPEAQHIPLLLLGGALRQAKQIDVLLTQSDLVATLLAQLQLPYTDFPFSRNVLGSSYSYPFAYYTFNDGFGFIDSTGVTVVDNALGKPLIDKPSPSSLRRARGEVLLQTTHDDLARR